MNTSAQTLELPPTSETFTPVEAITHPVAARMISETQPVPAAGLKSWRAKWLLLPAGLCATLLVVKAALLLGDIYAQINNVYDGFLS